MPTIAADTPTEDYTIAGEVFAIPMPYNEGHVLTAGEASQLNQVFAENIRNNMASKISALKEAGTFDATAFQTTVDEYCSTYQMGVRTGGGGRTTDPVSARALDIAKDLVKNAIKAKGISLAAVSAAQITAKAKEVLAANPQILETARAQVEAAKSLASVEFDSLPAGDEPQAEAPVGKKTKAA